MFYPVQNYRQLNHEQLRQLQQLVNICHRHDGYRINLPWQRLNYQPNSACLTWVVIHHGQIIAYLGIADCQPVILVHPACRQQGIANRLLQALSAYPNAPWKFVVPTAAKTVITWLNKRNLVPQYTYHELVCQQAPVAVLLPEFTLRRAKQLDVTTLAHIHAAGFNREFSQTFNFYQSQLDQRRNSCWLGVNATGQAIAIAQTQALAKGYVISNLAVLPTEQGQGYGRALVTHLLRRLAPKQKQSAWLEVLANNDVALSLYKKCGFNISGDYDYYRIGS